MDLQQLSTLQCTAKPPIKNEVHRSSKNFRLRAFSLEEGSSSIAKKLPFTFLCFSWMPEELIMLQVQRLDWYEKGVILKEEEGREHTCKR